jgi:hypothetical protein
MTNSSEVNIFEYGVLHSMENFPKWHVAYTGRMCLHRLEMRKDRWHLEPVNNPWYFETDNFEGGFVCTENVQIEDIIGYRDHDGSWIGSWIVFKNIHRGPSGVTRGEVVALRIPENICVHNLYMDVHAYPDVMLTYKSLIAYFSMPTNLW